MMKIIREADGTFTLKGITLDLTSKDLSSTGKTYKVGYEKIKTAEGVTIAVNAYRPANEPTLA